MAEAVAGFEGGLAEARSSMDGWRLASLSREWSECSHALDESLRRSERLRMEASPAGYEELAPILADLMGPLEAFERAVDAFRQPGA